MSTPFETDSGRKALEKVGFSPDENGEYPLAQQYGPLSNALAIVAMIEWLEEQWPHVAIQSDVTHTGRLRSVTAWHPGEDTPHILETAPTHAEALIAAVLATEEKK